LWAPKIERGVAESFFGLLDRVKPIRTAEITFNTTWQLFSEKDEPVTEEIEISVPQEITLGQLIANFIAPRMGEEIDARATFNWRSVKKTGLMQVKGQSPTVMNEVMIPPRTLRPGYKFQVRGTVFMRKPEVELAKMAARDSRIQIWIRRDMKIGDLKRTLEEFLEIQGVRHWTEFDEDEESPIDFNRVH
jgi:hypothetical protein